MVLINLSLVAALIATYPVSILILPGLFTSHRLYSTRRVLRRLGFFLIFTVPSDRCHFNSFFPLQANSTWYFPSVRRAREGGLSEYDGGFVSLVLVPPF